MFVQSNLASSPPCSNQQQGSALIIGLIMLVVLSMIGLSSLQTTMLQERMAGNLRDRSLAFEAAEVALREGEMVARRDFVPNAAPGSAFSGPGLFDRMEGNPVALDLTDLTDPDGQIDYMEDNGVAIDVVDQTFLPPRYIVERQESWPLTLGSGADTVNIESFKITALGFGGTADAVVILQSTIIVPIGN